MTFVVVQGVGPHAFSGHVRQGRVGSGECFRGPDTCCVRAQAGPGSHYKMRGQSWRRARHRLPACSRHRCEGCEKVFCLCAEAALYPPAAGTGANSMAMTVVIKCQGCLVHVMHVIRHNGVGPIWQLLKCTFAALAEVALRCTHTSLHALECLKTVRHTTG